MHYSSVGVGESGGSFWCDTIASIANMSVYFVASVEGSVISCLWAFFGVTPC
jgi:hypothetical protein